jgi:ArsR family transcriptional regulator
MIVTPVDVGFSAFVPESGIGRSIDYMAKSPSSSRASWEVLMAQKKKDIFRQQARVLKALANESRLKIIDRLSRGECSVGELADLVGSDRSTISKHLALLRAHGIVLDRREGSVVYYTLRTPCVVNFFSCATQVLKEWA